MSELSSTIKISLSHKYFGIIISIFAPTLIELNNICTSYVQL